MPAKRISLGFSIADAENVALRYDGETLVVTFEDWQERRVAVTFSDTAAFRWQRAEDVGPGEAWDGANLVEDSPWLGEHRRHAEATDDHRHVKLNFNAAGCLEVICIDVQAEHHGA